MKQVNYPSHVSAASDPGQARSVTITANCQTPVRIDQYLVQALTGYSRSVIKKIIDNHGIRVNGQIVKASHKLKNQDQIEVELSMPAIELPQPEDIPIEVVYEDEYLAVVNKPPGMVVHPAKGNWQGTLVNALQFHFEQLSAASGEYRPGIVHRLDRDTSGVILIAKDEQIHQHLALLFENRQVYKEYLTITQGVLDRDSDYIELAIGPHPRDRIKMAAYNEIDEDRDIKAACTFYEVIERFEGFTYCQCYPKTGRTHQIRVHLAYLGCPVLADKLYSGRDKLLLSDLLPDPVADEVLLSRQALHAHRLRFQHPLTQQMIEACAPIPSEFLHTLDMLRQHRPIR